MSNSLEVLAKNRDALLLAEAAAWLHMFGKFHEEFLEGKHGIDIEIPEDVPDELYQLLTDSGWTGNIWGSLPVKEFEAQEISIEKLIRTHRSMSESTQGFLRLMADAHGRGSGIEKGLLDRFASTQEVIVYLLTSLGYETVKPINLNAIQENRQFLYEFLSAQLRRLKERNAAFDRLEWLQFRHNFIQKVDQDFLITVAETRRPLNDVTMSDQTTISVAFFKAALAQNLLQGWKEPNQSLVKNKYHWRLLRIGLDGSMFWENSARIGDLLSRKELIVNALDRVQTIIEVIYPLGFEVYRDQNSSVFIVPDIDKLHLQTYADGTPSLEKYIQDIAEEVFSGEAYFTLSLSESTRNFLSFGRLLTEQLPMPAPKLGWLKLQWSNRKEETCPICNLRPQGPGKKALRRKICDTCESRRIRRSQQWITNASTTIWIDEVADAGGHLALLVAQFDMFDWLSGGSFNTVLAFDPASRELVDSDRGNKMYAFDLHILLNDIQRGLDRPRQTFNRNTLLANLVTTNDRGDSNLVQDFYDLRILDTDLDTTSVPQPELLALSMIRQPPSFARIHRVWETTKKFWEDIEASLESNLDEVTGRLRIQGTFLPNVAGSGNTLGISHTYEARLGKANLSIVCVKDGEFLTVDNLYRTATLLDASDEYRENYNTAMTYVGDRLREREAVALEEATGYGAPSRELGVLRIESVTLERRSYLPAVSILTEPRTFMVLVPAEKALKVAESIREKYEREMNKVRNRLPLTVGIVFAGSRTPLPAILDSGRRMLKQPTQGEYWKIQTKPDIQPDQVKLTLERDGQILLLEVRTVMGDEKTEDVWYPYWHVQTDKDNMKPQGRKRQFVGVGGKDWVHVCDLHQGDTVHLMPSRFDFEFLDTAARRFEVSYEEGKRRGNVHPARPYYLEQLESFKELWGILRQGRLATSQIHNLVGLIEQKRLEWHPDEDNASNAAFEHIVRDILSNAEWKKPRPEKAQFEKLVQAGVSGQLTDVVEFNSFLDEELSKTVIDQRGGNL